MDDIQLVLVDLDNVRGTYGGPLDQHWPASEGDTFAIDPDAPACVVAFAMNLSTADHEVTFASLRRFAEQTAAAVAHAPLRGVEIALTLVVKEAADAALERLFAQAPRREHEGRLAAVHLLSKDLGLQTAIGHKLPSKKYIPAEHRGGRSWIFTGKGKAQARRGGRPGMDGIGRAASVHPHQAVHTRELIGQLAGRPIDVPQGVALHEIAGLVDRRPGLLTQLGLTISSLRGVDRMWQLADGVHPSLGPCEPDDGLEVCADVVPTGEYGDAQSSSLGPGTVRFRAPAATAVTGLPPSLIAAAAGPFEVAAGRVLDAALVETVDRSALVSAGSVKVRFSSAGATLKVEAQRAFGQPLAAWWWEKSGKTRSKQRLGEADLKLASFTVMARCAVDPSTSEVLLVAPFEGSVTATIKQTAGDIVAGSVNGIPVACLVPEGTAPGEVRVAPVQGLSSLHLRRRLPQHTNLFKHLRRLPLLVPA